MTIFLSILLGVLKFVGWALLLLLVLLVILLIIPVELRFAYEPRYSKVTAWYGPLHFTLWPRHEETGTPTPTAATPPRQPQPAASAAKAEPAPAQATQQADPLRKKEPASEPAASLSAPKASSANASTVPAPEMPPQGESSSSGGLPFGISARIEAAMDLLARDPVAFACCMFGHLCWVGRFLARHIKIRRLTVFWTVTGEDATKTAELYGAAMAAANDLLALLQQTLCLQCDRLWLEPDFTGQRKSERQISGRLHTHPFLLLWLALRLLIRLGKDPQLQPAASH